MSRLLFATLSFMSRLPVPQRWSQGLDLDRYVSGVITFPVIGLLLGAISGLVFMVVQAWCGIPLAAFFTVLALALLTGGFHLDGLADTCDGIFSARRREKMLEIMRDSRLGTHGGLALIFVLLAKVLTMMYRHRYAREEGLGNLFIGKISFRQTWVTLVIAGALGTAMLGMHGLRALLVAFIGIFILGQLLKRTLGGQTGDTLGASIELGEVIFLLALL